PMWQALLADLADRVAPGVISSRFHTGLAEAIAATAAHLAKDGGIGTVALSGGCFQNKTLLELTAARIVRNGLNCLTQGEIATNDGGLSLGQAAIAAARELKR